MEYPYTNKIIDSINKYEITNGELVDAIYTPAYLDIDKGNPFIEALPSPANKENIKNIYFSPFPITCSQDATQEQQLLEIQCLRQIRVPLPFLPSMETLYHNALMMSHRQRLKDVRTKPNTITVCDKIESQDIGTRIAKGGDTGIGLSLLGIGGCGKSEAISTMLDRYPQIICHNIKDVGKFIQIVWLNVVTPPNANLNDLYVSIAEALDDALQNEESIYTKNILKEKSVGAKAKYVAKLIRIFNISSIVLDEIQNLDNGKNKVSSYNSLMEIINTTKVALVLVGTEEAYSMLCQKYYLARRTGTIINASEYCNDRSQFNSKMRYIMQYNWFKPDVEMDDEEELLHTLFNLTCGVIDRMISLWTCVQIVYVMSKESQKPAITSVFLKLVANNTAPLLDMYMKQTLDNSLLMFREFEEVGRIEPSVNEQLAYSSRKEKADNLLMDILQTTAHPAAAERIFKRVKDALLLMGTPYNDRAILNKTVAVMKKKGNEDKSEDEIAQKVVASLKRNTSDARPKPKITAIDKDAFIRNFTE